MKMKMAERASMAALQRWPSPSRNFVSAVLMATIMACAGVGAGAGGGIEAEAAGSMNSSTSLGHMDGAEVGGSGAPLWANFTSRVFVVGERERARWPELELNTRTGVGIVLGGLGASLCTAAGIGGGGLFVPLFSLLLQFDSKTSAALSNFVMVGGQSVTMVLNLAQSHPLHPERSLIDFDAALLLQPNLLLGISTGVILNVVLPNWFITLSLTIVLSYVTLHSCRSGLKRWKKESHQLALPTFEIACKKLETQSSLSSSGSEISENLMESLLDHHGNSRFPQKKIFALAIVWLAFGAVQFLREGKGSKGRCGIGYWLLTALQVPLALIVTHYTFTNLRETVATHKGASESPDDGFVLGPEASSLFPKMALMTGIIGGMLGIAGAVIINPMLMSAGMHPQVTAATSGFMVVFSASMSVVQYWLMGRVPLDWAISSAVLSALCSAVGILLLQRTITKLGRASLVVFLVAFVVGISTVLMAVLGGWDVWRQIQTGAYMGFHYPC
ncbi:hypothetical protein MPTK1_4g03600 [Marchantia polymorpha subsp. ruderalis]|uniref:Sulfite exporter TauE/SafE family protein n=2 Tax=Marchantia polymorpha TaxID=3197 RepID=A0AAF6B5X1_MARPO|nr:hypothetical protein MARPO_0044s0113 [Marchantia polymorpha]BBN07405.1 hypothetical protein Mp_4g03600 [Marchantia polymorpha subsp. ruderalis]|eukprot:PTQ39696.1 hypothetical protein MARPO_0044s0113 [Marchantia polymorpha]